MTEEGLFDVHRVAEVTSKATGERLSKTRDEAKGLLTSFTLSFKGHTKPTPLMCI
jgi:hypothetical protein